MSRTRATFFVVTAIGLASWALISTERPTASADVPHPAAEEATVSPADAMHRLVDGNERFVQEKMAAGHRDASRRAELAGGQRPFAVVLGCADSRVPPELVFDQGLGDLFVIRVAGEVAPAEVIGSIEYALEHLGCRTVIVLGHERCGAVEAALGTAAPHAHVGTIVRRIRAAIAPVRSRPGDALDNAVRANVAASVNEVRSSKPLLAPAVQKGDVKVVGGRYDLDTGVVEILP